MNSGNFQSTLNAVEDIKRRLKEIDNRKRPPIKKDDVIKSAVKAFKRETSVPDAVLTDTFAEKKLADKKSLILNYPLPRSPKDLLCFTKFVASEIAATKREPDALTYTWREKLKQIYLFAEENLKETEELGAIQKYYKDDSRRARHAENSVWVWLLLGPIITAFSLAFAFQLPWLLFVAILATCWEFFLLLYVYDLLEKMIDYIKQRGKKQKYIPKFIRVIVWHLLMPLFAALIIAIVYQAIAWIWTTGILLFVMGYFLMFCYVDYSD